jgi:hypothetical protein
MVILFAAAVASMAAQHRFFAIAQRYLLSSVLAALAFRLAAERRSAV